MKNSIMLLFGLMVLFSCKQKESTISFDENAMLTHRKVDLSELDQGFLDKLNQDLYNAAIEGKIDAFGDDGLSEETKLSKEEVSKRGSTEEVIEYVPNPEYPDYYMDTVIYSPFRLSDIKGFELSELWIFDNETKLYHGKLNAFALRYLLIAGGVKLNEQALFWVKYEDLIKIFPQAEIDKLSLAISKTLGSKLSDY